MGRDLIKSTEISPENISQSNEEKIIMKSSTKSCFEFSVKQLPFKEPSPRVDSREELELLE